MSQPNANEAENPESDAEHELPAINYLNADLGIKSWLLTLDHKRIAVMYLVLTLGGFLLGGVLAMALPIARDLMNDGVRVNTILPGVFKTPMVAMMPPNVQDALASQVPFPKRLGQPEEYARLAVFIVENSYLNAEAIRLDGGIRMAPR